MYVPELGSCSLMNRCVKVDFSITENNSQPSDVDPLAKSDSNLEMASAQELSALVQRLENVALKLENIQGGGGAAAGKKLDIIFPPGPAGGLSRTHLVTSQFTRCGIRPICHADLLIIFL